MSVCVIVRRRGVVDFWSRLRGFAALGVPTKGWGVFGPQHPLLRKFITALASEVDRRQMLSIGVVGRFCFAYCRAGIRLGWLGGDLTLVVVIVTVVSRPEECWPGAQS